MKTYTRAEIENRIGRQEAVQVTPPQVIVTVDGQLFGRWPHGDRFYPLKLSCAMGGFFFGPTPGLITKITYGPGYEPVFEDDDEEDEGDWW